MLVDLICTELLEFMKLHPCAKKFVVTGSSDTPMQVQYGEVTNCPDPTTRHEEADVIYGYSNVFCCK